MSGRRAGSWAGLEKRWLLNDTGALSELRSLATALWQDSWVRRGVFVFLPIEGAWWPAQGSVHAPAPLGFWPAERRYLNMCSDLCIRGCSADRSACQSSDVLHGEDDDLQAKFFKYIFSVLFIYLSTLMSFHCDQLNDPP